jgi:ABC-type lipoprotein release transport system permease subunit
MSNPSDFNKNDKLNRLPRLADNLVRLQFQKSNGQFKITIPRGLARSLHLSRGDVLEAFIERGDLVLRVREIDVK